MRTPEADDLRLAAEWLRQYDDEHDGGRDTKRTAVVADWLDAQAIAAELRRAARENGVPVEKLRQAFRARSGTEDVSRTEVDPVGRGKE